MKSTIEKLIDMRNLLEYLMEDKEITEEEKAIYIRTKEQVNQKLKEEKQ